MESLARVLFGELDPSGRLPVDHPQGDGHEGARTPSATDWSTDMRTAHLPPGHRRHAPAWACSRPTAAQAAGRGRTRPRRPRAHRASTPSPRRLPAGVRRSGSGLISNPTGVVADLRHVVDVMAADDRVDLVAAFGPEHGFRGSAQAGGSEGDYLDPRTGIPVYDAYAKTPAQLADFFSAAGSTRWCSTSRTSARASTPTSGRCTTAWSPPSLAGVRFVVLDRPNPIGGDRGVRPGAAPRARHRSSAASRSPSSTA